MSKERRVAPSPTQEHRGQGQEQALRVGFTGTRNGVTHEQYEGLGQLIRAYGRSELHHGDCLGADVSAHNAAGCFKWRRIKHPASDAGRWRAWCVGADASLAAKPALERNRDIVDATHVLLACPAGFHEEQRSGTWATIRYARKRRRPVTIIWPDGTVTAENAPAAGQGLSEPAQDGATQKSTPTVSG